MLLIRLTLRPRVPVLPLELKAAILAECDLPTLATASRVSQEFLALAGPALYRDIDIDGEPRLRRLVRSPTVLPSVAPYLSLRQTRSFTLTYRAIDKGSRRHLPRLVVYPPLEIDELVLNVTSFEACDLPLLLLPFASSFDPIRLRISGGGGPWTPLARDLSLLAWPRLRRVDVSGPTGYPSRPHRGVCGLRGPGFTGRAPLIDLVYDLAWRDSLYEWQLERMAEELGVPSAAEDGPTEFGHVQVWVSCPADAVRVERALRGLHTIPWEVGVKTTGQGSGA